MTKEKIIKLYIADLNNLVANSDAKINRIMDLEDELEALKQGQSLPIDSVVGQSGQLVCKGRCDHGYKDEDGNELFCSIKNAN